MADDTPDTPRELFRFKHRFADGTEGEWVALQTETCDRSPRWRHIRRMLFDPNYHPGTAREAEENDAKPGEEDR